MAHLLYVMILDSIIHNILSEVNSIPDEFQTHLERPVRFSYKLQT